MGNAKSLASALKNFRPPQHTHISSALNSVTSASQLKFLFLSLKQILLKNVFSRENEIILLTYTPTFQKKAKETE
jgi:hypothetical protein